MYDYFYTPMDMSDSANHPPFFTNDFSLIHLLLGGDNYVRPLTFFVRNLMLNDFYFETFFDIMRIFGSVEL